MNDDRNQLQQVYQLLIDKDNDLVFPRLFPRTRTNKIKWIVQTGLLTFIDYKTIIAFLLFQIQLLNKTQSYNENTLFTKISIKQRKFSRD